MKSIENIKDKILSAVQHKLPGFTITPNWLKPGPAPVYHSRYTAAQQRGGWTGVRPGSWWNKSSDRGY
jgi:hypothetical protein